MLKSGKYKIVKTEEGYYEVVPIPRNAKEGFQLIFFLLIPHSYFQLDILVFFKGIPSLFQ